MDEGRHYDLLRLKAVIDNPLKSRYAKYQADRAIKDILRQAKDRKLSRMRARLIGAAKNYDQHEEWKISQQINDYLKREKVDGGFA